MRPIFSQGCAGLLLIALPGASHAWSNNPLNGAQVLCNAAGHQTESVVASDGAGGAIVAWTDFRAGTNNRIYAQHINSRGNPLWTANGVLIGSPDSSESTPRIVTDGAGGAVIAWIRWPGGPASRVLVQRVDATGQTQWTSGGIVLCSTEDADGSIAAASDGAGGMLVTWGDVRVAGSSDVYAQRVSWLGAIQWAANGQPVCTAAGVQGSPAVTSDGSGGFILAWTDYRAGNYDIYAQRLSAAGTPQWAANGVALCTAAGNQYSVQIAADEVGGAIASWTDLRTDAGGDVYAQRVSGAGIPLWAAGGVAVGSGTGGQFTSYLVKDGLGGAIIAWSDNRNTITTATDFYAQHMSAAGAGLWVANGMVICAAPGDQYLSAELPDGVGGAFFTWIDSRSGTSFDAFAQHVTSSGAMLATNGVPISIGPLNQIPYSMAPDGSGGAIVTFAGAPLDPNNLDLYAQRFTAQGFLASPEPAITSVRDVPGDEGGSIRVTWNASYLDSPSFPGILNAYRVWRSVPTYMLGTFESQRGTTASPDDAAASGKLLVGVAGLEDYAWELVGYANPSYLPSYSVVVPSLIDSLPGSNLLTVFMVQARGNNSLSLSSPPDSGYSVDNLAPQPPSPFTGQYQSGTTHLQWGLSAESDLAGFRLYRGGPASFVPGPANLISSQSSTGYTDALGGTATYKLTALDIHGNESAPSTVVPTGALGVEVPAPARFHLEPPAPNPAAAHAQLSIRFGLAREADYDLAIFDAQGRRVRALSHGLMGAGDHTVRWDGRAEGGSAAPAGLYFIRLDSSGQSIARRLVRVR